MLKENAIDLATRLNEVFADWLGRNATANNATVYIATGKEGER